MDQKYEIPSEAEIAHMVEADALRPTAVEMTLRITGGAIPDGQVVVMDFYHIELTDSGQLEITVHDEDNPDYDLFSDDSWMTPTRRHHLSMNLDRARLKGSGGEDIDGNPVYQVRFENNGS